MTCRGSTKKSYLACSVLIYVLFLIYDYWPSIPPSVPETMPKIKPACPPPYTLAVGDVPGPGSVDRKTHSVGNITR